MVLFDHLASIGARSTLSAPLVCSTLDRIQVTCATVQIVYCLLPSYMMHEMSILLAVHIVKCKAFDVDYRINVRRTEEALIFIRMA